MGHPPARVRNPGGAGADGGRLAPEATVAAAAFEGTGDVAATVTNRTSGREPTGGGYADDVTITTAPDACEVVPVLVDGAFAGAEAAGWRSLKVSRSECQAISIV